MPEKKPSGTTSMNWYPVGNDFSMGFWSDKLYPALPIALQNMAVSVYGLAWQRRRFGGVFAAELRRFKEREQYSLQEFRDYQTVQLRKLLAQAALQTPYYREVFQRLGLTEARIARFELEYLVELPFLEKNTLREQGTTALLSGNKEKGAAFFSSSGSTGTPTQILFSHAMHQRWSAAFEARIRHWAGVDRHDPRGMIGGRRVVAEGDARGPFYRYNRIERQTYFSAYHISAENAADYLEGMRKHRVRYMTGYAMSNYFLARFFQETGLEAPQLKAVLTSSEALSADMRQTFQQVYGCRTFDAWSGVEACGLVSECRHGRLHASPDVGILEFLDPETGHPAQPGQAAEVVCTGLLNFDQPLIRYRIGDVMRYSNESCPCGRHMPVVLEISGRLEDTVTGPDGRQMVRFHGIFVGISSIVEGQIIQHALDEFEVKVAVAAPLETTEKELIRTRMRSQLGDIRLEITEVDRIPRGSNGKFKAVVSLVKNNKTVSA